MAFLVPSWSVWSKIRNSQGLKCLPCESMNQMVLWSSDQMPTPGAGFYSSPHGNHDLGSPCEICEIATATTFVNAGSLELRGLPPLFLFLFDSDERVKFASRCSEG